MAPTPPPIPTDDISLISRILHGEKVPPERLNELARRYPFFRLPDLALVASGSLSPDERRLAVMRLSLAAGSPAALRHLADILPDAGASFEPFYPPAPQPVTPSTVETIDRFLSTYGTEPSADDDDETRLLERLILNPVAADYAAVLAAAEGPDALPDPTEAAPGSPDDRINRFILSHQPDAPASRPASAPAPARPATPPAPPSSSTPPILPPPIPDAVPVHAPDPLPDDSLLSESLAKIYIRRHEYTRAYEIIERLNLNFPEKSIYFADQLRFLRKIIDIQSKKSSKA